MKNFEHAAETLTELMKQRGLSAAELSRQTMIDPGILRSIMTGKRKNISTSSTGSASLAQKC